MAAVAAGGACGTWDAALASRAGPGHWGGTQRFTLGDGGAPLAAGVPTWLF